MTPTPTDNSPEQIRACAADTAPARVTASLAQCAALRRALADSLQGARETLVTPAWLVAAKGQA